MKVAARLAGKAEKKKIVLVSRGYRNASKRNLGVRYCKKIYVRKCADCAEVRREKAGTLLKFYVIIWIPERKRRMCRRLREALKK